MNKVYSVKCSDYSAEKVNTALASLLEENGLLDFIKEGMTIGIKANLVSFMKPEAAATTHPQVLKTLCRLITTRGAKVIIGDSPGGLYTPAFVNRVYAATGMRELEEDGVSLNGNYSQNTADFPEAAVAKTFQYTAWLDECDAVINFCKLKSHGMMGMSAAVKNTFGIIPGTIKPEYHFRYSNPEDFARMIVDLNLYLKPALTICDAVVGMEGNGPTAGTPKDIGLLLASPSPYCLDLLCAHIIGLDTKDIPTIGASIERGLCPDSIQGLEICGEYHTVEDFKNIEVHNSLLFKGKGGVLHTVMGNTLHSLLSSRPVLKAADCVGCKECYRICPAKAIVMKNGKPQINRKKCIRCFCCQEFCPKGALKAHRTPIARLLNK